jgi:hypothetical protein
MEYIAFGTKVWVSDDRKTWKERYYLGTAKDRTKCFISTNTEPAVKEYCSNTGEYKVPVYFNKYLCVVEPTPAYRPFKTAVEALTVIGQKVYDKKTGRSLGYCGIYKTGVMVRYPEAMSGQSKDYRFLSYSEAFKTLCLGEYGDTRPFGIKIN